MSSKKFGPTASLLRSSRLFSLPPPLPRPAQDLLGHVQSNKMSDTATLPHPIQQAIVTTPSGLARGDWGLKRQLPLKSTTNTSTPLFRINAVDTREHITDYDSASDLTLTLNKVQELRLPVTDLAPRGRKSREGARLSAFEPDMDNTDPEAKLAKQDWQRKVGKEGARETVKDDEEGGPTTRWKFKGPWVAGMTQGDFDAWVTKELKKRKPEFMAFLREHRAQQLRNERLKAARENGTDVAAVEGSGLSEPELTDYLRKLRQDYNLASELAGLINTFLDLPSIPSGPGKRTNFLSSYEATEKPPPSTHPSAGLTYVRSDAFLNNHPIFGPQARQDPVEARVLAGSRTQGFNTSFQGKVGVAGLVAQPPPDSGRIRSVPDSKELDEMRDGPDRRQATIDEKGTSIGLGTPGGNRIWVEPTTLSVDARGRTQLKTANPNHAAVNVKLGKTQVSDLDIRRETAVPFNIPAGNPMARRLDTPRRQEGASSGVGSILEALGDKPRAAGGARRS
jgi:hypothetical protein